MLARAARRKLRRDAFRSPTQLCEQLTLPWLCPAQMRWAASVTPVRTNTLDSRKRRASLSRRQETRSLATAADVQPSQFPILFDGLFPPWDSRSQSPNLAKLEPWDPSTPLILREPAPAPTSKISYGIGGDPIELYQNLHACLRVGRMDRATAIVERLTTLYDASAPEVIQAHNIYLRAMFELAEQNPISTSMAEIEEWYDEHMVQQAIEPTADTLVTLLRASMSFLEETKKKEAVRKYLSIAEEYDIDVIEDIDVSAEFSDAEFETLIRSQPDRYHELPLSEEQSEIVSTPAGYSNLIAHGLIDNPAHDIKAVKQKGYGLDTLKKSLSSFERGRGVAYPHEMEGTEEEKDRAYAYMRQLRLETDSTEAAVQRWKAEDEKLQEMGIHGVLKSKPLQALMWNWYTALLPLVKKEFALVKQVLSRPSKENLRDERHKYGPYLESCKPEKMAALTVSRMLQSCARGQREDISSLKVSVLTSCVGDDIEAEVNLDAKQRHEAYRKKQRRQAREIQLKTLTRIPKENKPTPKPEPAQEAQLDSFSRKEFPQSVKTRLGALAVELLLKSATITVTAEDPKTGKQLNSTQPAFHHHTGFVQGKRVGWIAPHHEIMNKLRNESVQNIATLKMPMIFEPKPWSAFDDGGYYTGHNAVVRTRASGDNAQRAYAHSAISNGDMDKVLSGLDVLGKVPWQINSDVFTVMAQAWNAGEGIGGMVSENSNIERPLEPAAGASQEERKKWLKRVKEYENTKAGLHSQRCFQNFQLEVARAFVKEKQIYFPHSIDFRGRAYPIPPLLNHIGADPARSLLRFANGKELGTVGLQWLKVHLANLYGYDKASLREREQFAMDNINEVYDSATNPLSGRRWWTKAEDPWQCLACCIELKNAFDSPDPTRFISRLPVHQDGTCNGLQHYAALGGDHAGASQVNLEPSDRPQDIYTGVAELVKEMVAEDAAKGHVMAQFVKDKISRKVVKRTVMTNVYGVTFMGAKLQVLDELKDIFPNFEETGSVKSLQQPALYIAFKIFAALGKIFNGAQEIQYWLGECGERITTSISADQIKKIQERTDGKASLYDSKYKHPKKIGEPTKKKLNKTLENFQTSIIWTTPLKMPVVQPYRKAGSQTVKTNIQDITVVKRSPNAIVDKRKQLQAFPPNFIHSLDATHMILSALKCSEMGLDFAAVHDSFWTHAADIPNLNVILRDAFVRMHSEDIIGRLAAEFKARYAGSMYRAQIVAATPVGRKISAWRKAHLGLQRGDNTTAKVKEASFEEVALEAKRLELLGSEDPIKRKEGEEMVTPTSIWLANQDPKALASFRLALLGETKQTSSDKFDEVKEKVLGAEVEAVKEEIEASGTAPADIAAEADVDVAAIEAEECDASSEPGIKDEAERDSKTKTKARSVRDRYVINAWLPLTFPPVPKKGSWDVARLRESKYFFS